MKKTLLFLMTIALLALCMHAGAAQETAFSFDATTRTLTGYTGEDASVVIPDAIGGVPVERLGNGLFEKDQTLTEVVLPDSVHTLEQSVFCDCPQLASITLPTGLIAIGGFNIYKCGALRSVTVPASVALIGASSFSWCENLKEIRFEGEAPALASEICFSVLSDDLVVYVPDDQVDAYRAVLPESVRNIQPSGKKAVRVDRSLPDDQFEVSPEGVLTAYLGSSPYVPIPQSVRGIPVTAIGSAAFQNPSGSNNKTVFRVDIPEGVTDIQDEAFKRCTYLGWVSLPSTLKTIGSGAFYWFMGRMSPLPDSLEKVGSEAFYHAAVGNELYVPKSLTNIGKDAFRAAAYLYELYFPKGMESIGEGAFAETNVSYIAFEDAVLPPIAPTAFNASVLKDVDIAWNATRAQFDAAKAVFAGFAPDCTVWRNNPATVDIAAYPENKTEIITIKDGVWTAYHGDAPDLTIWTSYDKIKVTAIGDGLFKGNQSIRSFYPHHADWFTTIGREAFKDSTVEYVEMFDSITTIGERAFSNCARLTELTLPKSLTHIGEGAFEGLTGLKRLTILCDLSILPKDAFKDMTALESVEIDFGAVPARLFEGSPVQSAVFGEKVTAIGEAAFSGTRLREVRLSGATDIAARAFENIPAEKVILPPQGQIDPAAFAGVDAGVMRVSDAAEDEYVAALSAQLGFPWYAPLLRESETSSFASMPYMPSAKESFLFDAQTGTITGYTGSDIDVVIPAEIDGVPVRAIAYSAFESCRDYTGTDMLTDQTKWTHLRSVIIPETVTAIEDSAFNYCQQLETVVCYAPLETTGRGVFAGCRALKNVIFVNGVRTIDNYCFESTGSLDTLYVGKQVESIGTGAFSGTKARFLVLDARNVANSAIMYAEELTEIYCTGRIDSVESGAVANVPKLAAICFESDDLSFIPNDGMVIAPAGEVTVTVPETSSEEALKDAQRVVSWSQPMPTVTVVKGSCARPSDALPDIDALLASQPPVTPSPENEPSATAAPQALPLDEKAVIQYAGGWQAVSMSEGGVTMTPDQLGMQIALTLQADGTATITSGEEVDQAQWQPTENGLVIVSPEETISFILHEDGGLEMIDEGFSVLFNRTDASAAGLTAPTENRTAAAETPAPSGTTDAVSAYLRRTFVCKTADVAGVTLDAAQLGAPYTVTFGTDGKAVFVMAGAAVPPLDWVQETAETKEGPKDALVLTYFNGDKLPFVMTDAGFDLDFFGSMLMHFVPQD